MQRHIHIGSWRLSRRNLHNKTGKSRQGTLQGIHRGKVWSLEGEAGEGAWGLICERGWLPPLLLFHRNPIPPCLMSSIHKASQEMLR